MRKKNFGSEFVKLCHEQVIWFYLNFWSCIKNIWDMVLRIPNFKFRTFRLLWRKNKQNFLWLVKKLVHINWEFGIGNSWHYVMNLSTEPFTLFLDELNCPLWVKRKALSLLEACFDLISSPSPFMKVQIMGGKITEYLGFESPFWKDKKILTFWRGDSNPRFSVIFLPTIWIFMEGEGDKIKSRRGS